MKKFSTLLLCGALALIGCSNANTAAPDISTPPTISEPASPELSDTLFLTGADLLANASPETSALAFYIYDGETVEQRYLFEEAETRRLLGVLSAVTLDEAADWTPADLTAPIYGIEIGGKDGWTVQGAWSNGYWIAQDGTVYGFDFDLSLFTEGYSWSDVTEWNTTTILPCARFLAQAVDGWHPEWMTPSATLVAPEGITAELIKNTKDSVTISLTNHTDADWMYGEGFSLQVLLDGVWYNVPETPGNWAFNAIGYSLSAGDSVEKTYSLESYGDLPTGTYRLETEGLTAEFNL